LFQNNFISDEIGAAKPSQAFFDAACRAVPEIEPEHTLVIGDSLSSDIAGGFCWGTDTCWVSHGKILPIGSKPPRYIITHLCELADILL
jgi:FMN phosphatase YigB (HAD superfamily)